MKKTILFYSALLLTVAGSAQTSVQSQQSTTGAAQVQKQAGAAKVKSSGNASAATTVQTDAAAKAESKAKGELATKKEVIAGKKDDAETAGKTAIDKVANKEVSAEASVHTNNNVKAGENQAQVHGNGSLNTGTAVSLNKVNDNALEVKKEVATRIENKTNATVQTAADVKTAVHTKTSATVQQAGAVAGGAGSKAVTTVKAKPAPVKVKSQVNTAAGIKLR